LIFVCHNPENSNKTMKMVIFEGVSLSHMKQDCCIRKQILLKHLKFENKLYLRFEILFQQIQKIGIKFQFENKLY
jgi:hypothetical protein